jgi:hypothetical protein
MGMNRKDEGDDTRIQRPHLLQAAEMLRSAAANTPEKGAGPRGEEKISVFWRVFGGTLLSIAALVVMTVYQQFSANLNELRAAINHINEVQGDLVKKDEVNSRVTPLWTATKEAGTDVATLKTQTALLASQSQGSDKERKELRDKVESLSERLAALEARVRVSVSPTVKVADSQP